MPLLEVNNYYICKEGYRDINPIKRSEKSFPHICITCNSNVNNPGSLINDNQACYQNL